MSHDSAPLTLIRIPWPTLSDSDNQALPSTGCAKHNTGTVTVTTAVVKPLQRGTTPVSRTVLSRISEDLNFDRISGNCLNDVTR